MLWSFKISYIYVNSRIDSNSRKKIIKLKMTILLHSFGDYKVIILKRCLKIYNK
jgi:hypothetical protein